MKLKFKNLLCRLNLGHWLIEYCDGCGSRQPLVWWSDSALWLAVVGERGGVLCPCCFDIMARKKGLFLRWYPQDESVRVLEER